MMKMTRNRRRTRAALTRSLVPAGSLAMLLVAALFSALPGAAGARGLSEAQGEAILEELKRIRQTLQRIESRQSVAARPAPPARARPRLEVNLQGSPALGAPEAPVTLVEFTDYECPFCRRFFAETLPRLRKQYIETGRLRLVVKDLPLDFHPLARGAAEAARCAGEQGAYWPMHDRLFGTRELGEEKLAVHARTLGLDADAFLACLASDRQLPAIERDLEEARRLGIRGTPTFVLGPSGSGTLRGIKITGAQGYEVFRRQIEALLAARP